MKRAILKHPVVTLLCLALMAGCGSFNSPKRHDTPKTGEYTSGAQYNGAPKTKRQVLMSRVAPPPYEEKTAPKDMTMDVDLEHNTEGYDHIVENAFRQVSNHPLSTFSIDVDTASYANVRRILREGRLPQPDAVRIEELLNYFSYEYKQPTNEHPFAVHLESTPAPWNTAHKLVRIALKGKEIARGERPQSNLVFLLDVSGSMRAHNKLPLLKRAMALLVQNLDKRDTVSIVVYAGASGLVLPPTSANNKSAIIAAMNNLSAGGSTNGGAGIELAYKVAQKNFIKGGINRVIIASDGDMNVGTTSRGALVRLIEDKAKSGVFLSVLGLGRGNYKDSTMEALANKGNGNYAYIDSMTEARKVLGTQMGGTLVTIAKDVKIQVEFNPAKVAGYRLIGYENRLLNNEDFNNDAKDAGELGAGHTVTALYEVVPAGTKVPTQGSVDPLKYQKPKTDGGSASKELLTVKLRYKTPQGSTSTLLTQSLDSSTDAQAASSKSFKMAQAVAAFGMMLRNSKHKGSLTWSQTKTLATEAVTVTDNSTRLEFLQLVKEASALAGADR